MEEETEMAGDDHQDPRNRVSIALAAGTKRCAWELHSPWPLLSLLPVFPVQELPITCGGKKKRVAPKEVAQYLQ